MHETISELLKGESEVADYYERANLKWENIFKESSDTIEELTERVNDEVVWFESKCGGSSLGHEIMFYSGFGYLYHWRHGFEENKEKAEMLLKAFKHNDIKMELKHQAIEAAELYDLCSTAS